jgi:SAM-dependent methyltransferase
LADWPDLKVRRHELPPRGSALGVVGDPPGWLRETYDVTVVEQGDGKWRLWTVNPVLERVVKARSQPGTVIDLGCGQGRDAVWLAANGWQVIAVDHLPDAIERGRDLQARYAPGSVIQWEVGDLGDWQSYPADLAYMAYGPTHRLGPRVVIAGEVLMVGFSQAHFDLQGKPNPADLITPTLATTWKAEYGELNQTDRLAAFLHRKSD